MSTYTIRYVPEPYVPVDALQLNEDLQALRQAQRIIDNIMPENCADERKDGYRMLRLAKGNLKMCERYAEQKLRTEYLAPRKRKVKK